VQQHFQKFYVGTVRPSRCGLRAGSGLHPRAPVPARLILFHRQQLRAGTSTLARIPSPCPGAREPGLECATPPQPLVSAACFPLPLPLVAFNHPLQHNDPGEFATFCLNPRMGVMLTRGVLAA
jgi:hypothetical protein